MCEVIARSIFPLSISWEPPVLHECLLEQEALSLIKLHVWEEHASQQQVRLLMDSYIEVFTFLKG